MRLGEVSRKDWGEEIRKGGWEEGGEGQGRKYEGLGSLIPR